MTDNSGKQRMVADVESGGDDKDKRKTLRLKIAREALRLTFGLLSGVLLLAFVIAYGFGGTEILNSVVLNIVISGLFGVLTLIIGFVAGTSID